jgi:uncharacterized protein
VEPRVELVVLAQPAPNMNTWITTYTGKHFFALEPNPDDIDIQDIAHALSNVSRFVGHCREFYSVAQHSVLVSQHCKPEHALYGLCHDMSESYLNDVPTPLKQTPIFEGYRKAEHHLQSMIYAKFGMAAVEPDDVKVADQRVLATEMRDLMPPSATRWKIAEQALDIKIEPLLPQQAKQLFLQRFYELTGNKYVNSTT